MSRTSLRRSQTLTHEEVFGVPPTEADDNLVRGSGVLSDDVRPTTVAATSGADDGEAQAPSSLISWMASAFSPAGRKKETSAVALTPAAQANPTAPPPTPADGAEPAGTPRPWIGWASQASPAAEAPVAAAAPAQSPGIMRRISNSLSRMFSASKVVPQPDADAAPESAAAAEESRGNSPASGVVSQSQPVERSLDMAQGSPAKRASTEVVAVSGNSPSKGNKLIASPGKKSPKKASPVKASPKKATPVKASPKKATPVKASPKKASPVKASPKKASPKKASPVKSSPKKATPAKASPVKASPKKATPAKASPKKATPAKATPAKASPKKATPAKATPAKASPVKASPKKATPAKASPVKASPKKASPAKASPKKATPAKATPAKASPKKATPAKATPAKASPKKASPVKASPVKGSAKKSAATPAKRVLEVELPSSAKVAELSAQVARLGGNVPADAKRAVLVDLAKACVRSQTEKPSDSWTTGMLAAYAKSRGVDAGRKPTKKDYLKAFRA